MNAIKKITLATIALFAALSTGIRADVPLGDYSIDFENTTPFWDISGSYTQTVDGIDLDYTLVADQYGKITGQGTATADLGLDVVIFDFELSGSVKGSGSDTRVKYSMKAKTSGVTEGRNYRARLNLDWESGIDTAQLAMVGTIKGRLETDILNFDKNSYDISVTDVVLNLPEGMDGTWTLDTTIYSLNGKIGSSLAEITLSNGSVYPFVMKGTYTPATDVSSMKLKGGDTNKRMSAAFTAIFTGPLLDLKSFKGTALGQTRTYTPPVVPAG